MERNTFISIQNGWQIEETMLNRLRTNRSVTGFFAMALFVASVHPFIEHVCLMAEAHDVPVTKECCCEQVHRGHEGMEEMPGAACDSRDGSHADDHGMTPPGYCCSVELEAFIPNATSPPKATTHEFLSLAPFILPQHSFLTYPRFRSGRFKDLGPPPLSSSRLYILFAQLLN